MKNQNSGFKNTKLSKTGNIEVAKRKATFNILKQRCHEHFEKIDELVKCIKNNNIGFNKNEKHRPILYCNQNTQDEQRNVKGLKFSTNIQGVIQQLHINYERKKINRLRPNLNTKNIIKKQNGCSLLNLCGNKELCIIADEYENEKKYITGIINELDGQSKLNILFLFTNIECYLEQLKKLNMSNRIMIIKGNEKIKNLNYFYDDNIDYDIMYIFTPPYNYLFTYSIHFHDNICELCNSYIIVRNSKKEWHFFYGYSDLKCEETYQKINDKVSKNLTENELLSAMFEFYVNQNTLSKYNNNYFEDIIKYITFPFESITITKNNGNNILFNSHINKELEDYFLEFFTLYYSNKTSNKILIEKKIINKQYNLSIIVNDKNTKNYNIQNFKNCDVIIFINNPL